MEVLIRWPQRRNTICRGILTAGGTFALFHLVKHIDNKYGDGTRAIINKKYQQVKYLNRLKLILRTKIFLIKHLPVMYYFVLPHFAHKFLVTAHTLCDNGSHWKYATFSKFVIFTSLYGIIFYMIAFFLKIAVSPAAMKGFQKQLLEKFVITSLRNIQDKKLISINDILIEKYKCPHSITDIIWSYVFTEKISNPNKSNNFNRIRIRTCDNDVSWYIDGNKYSMTNFIKNEVNPLSNYIELDYHTYSYNPILYLNGWETWYEFMFENSKIEYVDPASAPVLFLVELGYDYMLIPILGDLFAFNHHDLLRDGKHVLNLNDRACNLGGASSLLGRYPLYIVMELMFRNEFVLGPCWYGEMLADTRFHQLQQNKMSTTPGCHGMHPKYIKLISVIYQNWQSIAQYRKGLKYGKHVLNKVDFERYI